MRPIMTSAIDALIIKGQARPKTYSGAEKASCVYQPCINTGSLDKSHQFPLNDRSCINVDLAGNNLSNPTESVRKMENLSRVRNANFGNSTIQTAFTINGDSVQTVTLEKPQFVLCGVSVGSKDIESHIYMNETVVDSFKTPPKELFRVRRGTKAWKGHDEPALSYPVKELLNYDTNLPDSAEQITHRTIPPIPLTTPLNFSLRSLRSAPNYRHTAEFMGQKFHGSIPTSDIDCNTSATKLHVKHQKLTLLPRNPSNDSIYLHREHSSLSTRSGKSVETVTDSVINNSLTVTIGKGAKLVSWSQRRGPCTLNYNNPYRNTKCKDRLALYGNKLIEFNSLDNYFKYQKQQLRNGKHVMMPRAILRIPRPCSDTFLLKMMCDLNRPTSTKLTIESTPHSRIGGPNILEEYVQTRTPNSLNKTQTSISKYTGKQESVRSIKSGRSVNTVTNTVTIEEES